MKRIFKVSMILVVSFVLVGCSFPSQRLMKIDPCDDGGRCGSGIITGSELALVKEARGGNWRLWHKLPAGSMDEICTGTIDDDKFRCPRPCNTDGTAFITVKEVNSSSCEYDQCVKLVVEGGDGCPGGGTGTGGHN